MKHTEAKIVNVGLPFTQFENNYFTFKKKMKNRRQRCVKTCVKTQKAKFTAYLPKLHNSYAHIQKVVYISSTHARTSQFLDFQYT